MCALTTTSACTDAQFAVSRNKSAEMKVKHKRDTLPGCLFTYYGSVSIFFADKKKSPAPVYTGTRHIQKLTMK